MNLSEVRHIYFLGIGGIGMSALARYFHRRGKRVSGYDKTPSDLTRALESEGMSVHYEDVPDQLPADIDLVVLTPAIPKDHREWAALREKNIPIKKRAEVLGMISRDAVCLAVAGTHGKTTTTTLLAHLLRSGGVDCNAFLGGIAVNYGTNYLSGSSDIVVVEADEYDRSFLQLNPSGLIVTAIDPDHLDIYGDADSMRNTYEDFIHQVQAHGTLIIKEGLNLKLGEGSSIHATTYGWKNTPNRIENVRVKDGFFVFDYHGEKAVMKDLWFAMPGRHNAENATAAISLALAYGASESGIREGLKNFKGIKRRFEFVVRNDKQVLIDDYAHHPEELKAAISAAKELYPDKKITGMFQPHLFSRTRDFEGGFAESLSMLDELILLDIYPARELPIEGVSSSRLLEKIKCNTQQLLSKEAALDYLIAQKPEVLLVLGAGDIDRLVEPIRKGWMS